MMHQSTRSVWMPVWALEIAIAALSGMAFISSAEAANATWSGATDALWATLGNWNGAASVPGAGETATFNATSSNTTINVGTGLSVDSIVYDTASAAAYTIGSGAVGSQTLTLTNGVTINAGVTTNQLFNANVLLGTATAGTYTFTNNGSGTLTFSGTVRGGSGGTAGAKTLNIGGSGATTFGNTVGAGGGTNLSVTNVGAGTVTLSGAVSSSLNMLRAQGSGWVIVDGQAVTVSASSLYNSTGKFELKSGSVAFNAGMSSSSTSDGSLFRVSGGSFSATTVTMGRTGNNSATATSAAPSTSGFVVTAGTATLSGVLDLAGSNSNASGLVSGGSLSVAGEVRIGNSSGTTSRWFVFQVSGGSFASTDATNGIVLARGTTNANNTSLLLTGGTTTAEKISFGVSTTASNSAGVVTLNGATAGLYLGSGGIVLSATNPYTATVTLTAGLLGAKSDWSSSLPMSLNGTGTAVTFSAADAAGTAKNIAISGVLSGAGGFVKTGGGSLTLSGSSSYTGSTSVTAGTLLIDSAGSINSTSGITINGASAELKYNSATALSQPITFTRGTLSGTGSIGTAVTVGSSDILSPGNSPGSQSFTSGLTFAPGGKYVWEINNWTGSPGTNYDQLVVSGSALNITATSGTTFTIALTSLTGSNTAGAVPGFSGTAGTSFTIATSSAGITGFDKSKFSIDQSAFTNNNTLPPNAGFWLSTNGGSTSLILNYAPSATYNLSAAASAAAIRVGGTSTITATVTSSTASVTNPDSLSYTGLALSGGLGTLSSTSGTLAGGATSSGSAAFTTLAANSYTFLPSVASATNVNIGTSANLGTTSGVTVTVYNPASATSLSGTTVVLTNVHVGQSFGTQSLSISNTGTAAAAFQEGLAGSYTSASGDASGSGSFANLFTGSASTAISVGLGNTATAGVKSGTVTLGFTSTGTTSTGATGLNPLPLASQTLAVTGTVWNYAAANNLTTPISLGNVYVGGTFGTSAVTISNTAPSTFSEGLNASFGSKSGIISNNGLSITNLVGGGTDTTLTVGLGGSANTGSAGALSGTQSVTLVSNGDNSGLSNTNLNSQTLTITGTVWNPAAVNSLSPVTLGNVHVGGTFGTSALSIRNTAVSGSFTEVLGATGSSSGLASLTGSVAGLAGGGTSTGISVGLGGSSNTATAGVKSGTAAISFTSTGGPGTALIAAQNVAVTGTVFNYAAASSVSGTIDFGTVLKGTTLSQALSITNTAPAGSYSEKLDAAFNSFTGSASGTGVINLLTAGGTSAALSVSLASGSAGAIGGTAVIGFTSNGAGTSGLGTTSLDPQTVNLVATVLDPATALLVGGSSSGSNWFLNLGEFQQGSGTSGAVSFGISNLTQTAGFTADLFLASFANPTSSGAIFTDLTGTSSFATLASGSTNPFTAWMSLATTGTFTNTYNLSFNSSKNGTSLGGTPQNVTLTVTGIIVVPEPGAVALAGIGIAATAWAAAWRGRRRAS